MQVGWGGFTRVLKVRPLASLVVSNCWEGWSGGWVPNNLKACIAHLAPCLMLVAPYLFISASFNMILLCFLLCWHGAAVACMQVVMGHEVEPDEVQHLSKLFNCLSGGVLAWPYLDIPFTPFNK